jgi:carbamoyl-phosphate synthase large subunit
MNILITSAGRRTKLVEYFKKELNGKGKLIVTDCSEIAPTVYLADKSHLVSRMDSVTYIDELIDICKKESVKAVLSLIDPELSIIAENRQKFEAIGVVCLVSPIEVCDICFDKYTFFEFCEKNGFRCAKTYISIEGFLAGKQKGEVNFPVFVKPRCGSASLGINIVHSLKELELVFSLADNLIIQEYLKGFEIGADVYVDLLTKEVVSIFTKKKLLMRAGETDKAISLKDEKLFSLVESFINQLGILAQTDIDIFKVGDEYYISEVNPRFGGGYLHAYECGCNFPQYIINNLEGKANEKNIGNYEENMVMMKHDTLTMIKLDKQL